jgi:hypothetical protein
MQRIGRTIAPPLTTRIESRMPRLPHRAATLIASLSLVAALGFAGPAAAKGGSTPAPAPAPAPAPLDCFGDFGDPTIPNMTDPDVGVNYAGNAGCVGVRSVSSTQLRLAWVVLAPNWTYVVKSNGEGTNSRVQLQFTNTVTGEKIDFRYEFGKTVIG